jgi:hypothetical protein
VAARRAGLLVFDLLDPASPMEIGAFATGGAVWSPLLAGKCIYLADGATGGVGLWIVDVSDPANPQAVSTVELGEAYGVAVNGRYAYLAVGSVVPVDISDPSKPVEAGQGTAYGSANGIAVVGSVAYVADGSALQVINVHDPAHLQAVDRCTACGAGPLAISGSSNLLWTVTGNSGLQVIDVTNPSQPRARGAYQTSSYANAVSVSGQNAYVACWTTGLQIIDIEDPDNPQLRGEWSTNGETKGVVVSGASAYRASGAAGLRVIDISDPTEPELAGSFVTGGSTDFLAVSGQFAYVGDSNTGLQVIDSSDPAHLQVVGTVQTITDARGIATWGSCLLAAGPEHGLVLVDVSNPTRPRLVGTLGGFQAYNIAVVGDRAYVAAGQDGLIVVDIVTELRLAAYALPTTAGFPVTIRAGVTGQTLRLQRSRDLVTWEDWTTVSLTDFPTDVLDAAGASGRGPCLFYRAVAP